MNVHETRYKTLYEMIFHQRTIILDIFMVLALIDLLRKDKEYFLNSSQSVNWEYLSIIAGLKTIFSFPGMGSGSVIV